MQNPEALNGADVGENMFFSLDYAVECALFRTFAKIILTIVGL